MSQKEMYRVLLEILKAQEKEMVLQWEKFFADKDMHILVRVAYILISYL